MGVYLTAVKQGDDSVFRPAPVQEFLDNRLIGVYDSEVPTFKVTEEIALILSAVQYPVPEDGAKLLITFDLHFIRENILYILREKSVSLPSETVPFLQFIELCITYGYWVGIS